MVKVREHGRVVNTAALVATGVNADGHREILGLDVGAAEDGAAWTAFLRSLVARGLAGVKLVCSDAHQGLKDAVAAVLDGAAWQRCRTISCGTCWSRFLATPRRWWPAWSHDLRPRATRGRLGAAGAGRGTAADRTVRDAAELLEQAAPDVLAYTGFPRDVWKKAWSNNPRSG